MPEPGSQPWSVSENDFPAAGTAAEKLRFLLQYAILAPSTHNTQPWFFKIHGDTVDLYADRTRALSRVDPGEHELIMSCGAALLHLRIALRHFGYSGPIETFPDPDEPDLLARIGLRDKGEATEEEHVLFQMIPKRRTNRLPFENREVPQPFLRRWQTMAAQEGAWLYFVEGDDARNLVADFIEAGDRIEWTDKLARSQLAAWIHPRGEVSSEGIPSYAFAPDDTLSSADRILLQTVNIGEQQAAKDRELAVGSPVLAVLGTDADTPPDWLAAGQALERVLLCTRAADVWASFLNQAVQVPALRPQLRDTLSRVLGRTGFPQLVFRMGYGPEAQPTPRRSLDEAIM